jgi:hypothetical protein
MRADNTWKVYLCVDDIARTAGAAASAGARNVFPPTPVADLGKQAVLVDPTGATLGAWQPGTFSGFTVLSEHGTPDWFELLTRDHASAVAFYRDVFGWDTSDVADSDEFRYTIMRNPEGEGELAGIMDAASSLPEGVGSHWSVYWAVDDADAVAARSEALGGAVVAAPKDTPYGRLATLSDPAGAQFKLRTTNH